MIADATILLLFVIAFSLILLNLLLVVRLIQAFRRMGKGEPQPEPLEQGAQLLPLNATFLVNNQAFDYQSIQHEAKVFLFLSSLCPKCKSKLIEIEKLISASTSSGVSIRLLTDEKPQKVQRFLQGTSLYENVLGITSEALKHYNPIKAYPYYLFVDQQDTLQAQGQIGDHNWVTFSEQILSDVT